MNTADRTGDTPLTGPFPEQTDRGDAALFRDEKGQTVARMTIMPCFAVPILILTHPTEHRPHPDRPRVVARCPLLAAPDHESYQGWDDPVFRRLCAQFGLDPDKQRPTFDRWFRDVGEALLDCASAAFHAKGYDEHGAAGLAAEALAQGATPDNTDLDDVIWRTKAIRDEALRERTDAALAQLRRSVDWQDGMRRRKAAAMQELIDTAREAGTPVTIVRDASGPGGVIMFGEVGGDPGSLAPSRLQAWWRRLFG